MLDHLGTWSDMLPLVEFTYNNGYHSSIGMASYEALYGRRCRTPLCWQQDGESVVLGPKFLQQTTKKVKMIQDQMLKLRVDKSLMLIRGGGHLSLRQVIMYSSELHP